MKKIIILLTILSANILAMERLTDHIISSDGKKVLEILNQYQNANNPGTAEFIAKKNDLINLAKSVQRVREKEKKSSMLPIVAVGYNFAVFLKLISDLHISLSDDCANPSKTISNLSIPLDLFLLVSGLNYFVDSSSKYYKETDSKKIVEDLSNFRENNGSLIDLQPQLEV